MWYAAVIYWPILGSFVSIKYIEKKAIMHTEILRNERNLQMRKNQEAIVYFLEQIFNQYLSGRGMFLNGII